MEKIKLLAVVLFIGAIQGCATLNKSECREADWRIIGMEDGSAGRPLTFIGRHRKSCAEYGVKPVMKEYKLGHSDGVRIFCTPRKGFELGKAGRGHNDVCPADIRESFITAYDDGRDVYAAQKAMLNAQNRIKSAQAKLDHVINRIDSLEAKLVTGGGTNEDRQKWLDEINQLQIEKRRSHDYLHDMQIQSTEHQREFEYLNRLFNY